MSKNSVSSAAAEVLDMGIGTGLVAREALDLVGAQERVVGVDASPGTMAEVALPGVEPICGRAEQLPRSDASSDFVSMGYALRRINDVSAVFSEFHRVLRPGGRLPVPEITKPAGGVGTALLKTYLRAVVPMIAVLVARQRDTAELWRYYLDTIESCIPPDAVLAALRAAGFENVQRYVELGIFSKYTAVKPACLLRPT